MFVNKKIANANSPIPIKIVKKKIPIAEIITMFI